MLVCLVRNCECQDTKGPAAIYQSELLQLGITRLSVDCVKDNSLKVSIIYQVLSSKNHSLFLTRYKNVICELVQRAQTDTSKWKDTLMCAVVQTILPYPIGTLSA